MSNPVATVGGGAFTPPDPDTTRTSYTKIVYDQEKFFVYSVGEQGSFDPNSLGQRYYIFNPMTDVVAKPDFIELETWDETVSKTASGFVSPTFSIMPKLMIPTEITNPSFNQVDNGVAVSVAHSGFKRQFNWEVKATTAVPAGSKDPIVASNIISMSKTNPNFISVNAKVDNGASNEVTLELTDANAGTGGSGKIARGAFCVFFNITPSVPGGVSKEVNGDASWSIKLTANEVEVEAKDGGPAIMTITGGEGNQGQGNLSDAQMKEAPKHRQHMNEKGFSFMMMVYPVWNGAILTSGIQDAQTGSGRSGLQSIAGTYVPKTKGASIFASPYSNPFNPLSPSEIKVGTNSDVIADFGTELTVVLRNCKAQLVYQPCWFSKEMEYDEWFLAPESDGDVNYDFDAYPIWTDNDTGADLSGSASSDQAGDQDGTEYWKVPWNGSMDDHARYGMEVFGEFLRTVEDRSISVRNSNGTFALNWTGGTPAGPAGTWPDYIQSLSITTSQDGSSGQIVVDKYGIAGTDAVATQSVGQIAVSMSGGEGTTAGEIFNGLAMGISATNTSDGATWTIPLVGFEQKLNDIALINAPFFDGFSAFSAINFLSKYGGISWTTIAGANVSGVNLTASDDISSPYFDFANGTPVVQALERVMENTQNTYVVEDALIKVYGIDGSNGLPIKAGATNWELSYPNVKLLLSDQRPIFDNLRNEIVVIGLEEVTVGSGKDIATIPLFPKIGIVSQTTVPNFAWAKSLVAPVQGHLDDNKIADVASKLGAVSKNFDVAGKVQIPGNASIELYDKWGSLLISSYTHNYDSQSKVWTTDLELVSGS